MKALHLVCLAFFALPSCLVAQQVRDNLDVVDGHNPTLRYGFYTEPSGRIEGGRYYFVDDGSSLEVSLVPYGKSAVDLPVLAYDREGGRLELGWEGKTDRNCRLDRHGEKLFLGNCLEGDHVMPMAIRVADEHDIEWMGTRFAVSRTDVDIVDRAAKLLSEQAARNQQGDRNCDDDDASGSVSVFCALYLASIEVAGVYRHRRPAINAVRDVLWERFPGDYQHLLRDINNRAEIPDAAFIEAFQAARAELLMELPASER